ncbi:hypothetical protein BB560_005934 [Smittium megazygosporum]|uniref:18S rRNA factor 2 n=1 Tax=Smittium megazygosporum TaxID=133381 RepID=A0A2T9YQA8_9FUNG|nr:hypothetical protein BB560_005934 [Smittium megazygosporum]
MSGTQNIDDLFKSVSETHSDDSASEEEFSEPELSKSDLVSSKKRPLDSDSQEEYSDLENEDLEEEKEKKTGVIYMSSVPPFMKPNKVRRLLGQYGKIGRIYLAPRENIVGTKKNKQGGSKKKGFKEGWIEFKDKKVAKMVAKMLNNNQIAFERIEREQRLKNELSQARKEASQFIQKVEKNKLITAIQNKKSKKSSSSNDPLVLSESYTTSTASDKTHPINSRHHHHQNKQRSLLHADSKTSKNVEKLLDELL